MGRSQRGNSDAKKMQHTSVSLSEHTKISGGVPINYGRLIAVSAPLSMAADCEIYVHKSATLVTDNEADVSH